MKKIPVIFLGVLLLFFMTGLNGQNRIVVEISEFNSLSVSGRADVELVQSDSHEMSITSRKGKPEEVEVHVKNGKLMIKTKPDLKKENEIAIKLPYSSLSAIESINGAVINSRKDLEGDALELKAITGGKIELSVKVRSIEARVAQGSDIILYGKTTKQDVSANTAGNYLAYEMECDESIVKALSGAQVKVRANKKIDATASSKGFIGYIGKPSAIITKPSLGGEIASFQSDEDAEAFDDQ